jgi:glycosyltransferase involved in cell wall biosynthesis
MLACGGAVLASDTPALAEVLGGRGTRIDPADADAWRSAMARAITDDDWRNTLRAGAVERAAGFTWASCARDTAAGYAAALRPAIHTTTGPTRPYPGGPCGASSTSTTTRPTTSAGPKS